MGPLRLASQAGEEWRRPWEGPSDGRAFLVLQEKPETRLGQDLHWHQPSAQAVLPSPLCPIRHRSRWEPRGPWASAEARELCSAITDACVFSEGVGPATTSHAALYRRPDRPSGRRQRPGAEGLRAAPGCGAEERL